MPNWKAITLILTFIIISFSARLGWNNYFSQSEQPYAVDGSVDLRDISFNENRKVTLDGEWLFYPDQRFSSKTPLHNPQPIQVPSEGMQQALGTNKGYGVYHLTVKVPYHNGLYALHLPSIRSASEIYINDQLIKTSGTVADNVADYSPKNLPITVPIKAKLQTIDIKINVANYLDPRNSGIIRSTKFGTSTAIYGYLNLSNTLQFLTGSIFISFAVLALILYGIGLREKRLLYFAATLALTTIMLLLSSDEKLLANWLDIPYVMGFRLINILQILLGICVIQLTRPHFGKKMQYFNKLWVVIGVIIITFSFFIPLSSLISGSGANSFYTMISFLITIYYFLKSTRHKLKSNILLVLALCSILNHFGWWLFSLYTGFKVLYYPFDLIMSLLLVSTSSLRQYYTTHNRLLELTEYLQHINETKNEFLATTAHELRNPLHSVLTISQAVLEREQQTLSPASKHDLALVNSVGRRMTLLIDDLLDMTKLQSGIQQLDCKPIALAPIITGVTDLLARMTQAKGLTVTIAISDDFPLVMADENRTTQIIYNLLHNAYKFTHTGEIIIRAYSDATSAYIEIEDTGIGIEPKQLATLFTPYQQASSQEDGFGLGLAISKQLAQLQKGDIFAASALGKGSCFTLQLPLQEHSAPTPVTEAPTVITKTITPTCLPVAPVATILLVDDDPNNLHVIKTVLANEGYTIHTSLCPKQALTLVQQTDFDLVISDVMMPTMSGYELTEQLREHFSLTELPILLVTARTRIEDIEQGFTSGANDYITKPVEMVELRARVRSLIMVKQSLEAHLQVEAAWLQAQIQPHFFFNTLNTIVGLSMVDPERMEIVLDAFTTMLRRKFAYISATEPIPLTDELQLVKDYLTIEQERYGDRLNIVWDIAPVTTNILPLTIQPLVENAVRHGIAKQKSGTITIAVSAQGQITIADDGAGMTPEFAATLLTRNPSAQTGIGIRNTHLRLKKQYGSGLTIHTAPNEGTRFTFTVPL